MKENITHSLMNMTPWEFDQSPTGWRILSAEGRNLEAAEIIKTYIATNEKKIAEQKTGEKRVSLEIMHFHIGQLLALSGASSYEEAIIFFELSIYKNKKAELWNAYVLATIGFLKKDTSAIDNAVLSVESSEKEDTRSGNLGIIKNFKRALEIGKYSYEEVYSWPRE